MNKKHDKFVVAAGLMIEILKRVAKGARYVNAYLQTIEQAAQMPSWYERPEVQVAKMRQFIDTYGDGKYSAEDIPSVPTAGLRDGEVWLLVYYLSNKNGKGGLKRTAKAYYEAMQMPEGIRKIKSWCLKFDARHLKMVDGYEWKPGIRWVAFNPNLYQGETPIRALRASRKGDYTLAGVEVLAAAYQFQRWIESWDEIGSSPPWLAGLRARVPGSNGWINVPNLDLTQFSDDGLCLVANGAGHYISSRACPGFRIVN